MSFLSRSQSAMSLLHFCSIDLRDSASSLRFLNFLDETHEEKSKIPPKRGKNKYRIMI